MQSNSIVEISKALCKVQKAIKEPKKNVTNTFFKSKYADLASIWGCARELLAENDLSLVQTIQTTGAETNDVLRTTLMHKSGEFLHSTATINPVESEYPKDSGRYIITPQAYGSCVTYLRRYEMSAILGVSGEDDDDANEATRPQAKKHESGGVKGMVGAISKKNVASDIHKNLIALLQAEGGETQDSRLMFLRSLVATHFPELNPQNILHPFDLDVKQVEHILKEHTLLTAKKVFP